MFRQRIRHFMDEQIFDDQVQEYRERLHCDHSTIVETNPCCFELTKHKGHA